MKRKDAILRDIKSMDERGLTFAKIAARHSVTRQYVVTLASRPCISCGKKTPKRRWGAPVCSIKCMHRLLNQRTTWKLECPDIEWQVKWTTRRWAA